MSNQPPLQVWLEQHQAAHADSLVNAPLACSVYRRTPHTRAALWARLIVEAAGLEQSA